MKLDFVGKISKGKETDKFVPFSKQKFNSGWERTRLIFNVACGDNRHSLAIEGGYFPSDLARSKVGGYVSNKDGKGGSYQRFDWNKRKDKDVLDKVASFSKRYLSLADPNYPFYMLSRLMKQLEDGKNVTDKDLEKANVSSVEELEQRYNEAISLRFEFLSDVDFAEKVNEIIDCGQYKDCKFYIKGESRNNYSEQNDKIYESFVPTHITLTKEDTEVKSIGEFKFYFNDEAITEVTKEDDADVVEKYIINGYELVYDNNMVDKQLPVPQQIVIDVDRTNNKGLAIAKRNKSRFEVEDAEKWYELGVIVNLLNGSQRMELTEEMLTEEEREDLELGIIDWNDLREAYGANVYGERIKENRFVKPMATFIKTGANETAYEDEYFTIRLANADLSAFDEDDEEDTTSESDLDDEFDDDDLFN